MTGEPRPSAVGDPAVPPEARRAAGITGSVIDSSTSLLERQTHDVVRFAMGSPAREAIPAAGFADLLPAVLGPGSASAFDYGRTEGESAFFDALLPFLDRSGIPASAEQLIVTAGGMQGLDLTAKLFVDPGDLVLVESPTYTNGTATIGSYEGDMIEVPTDDDGMVVEDLPELVADDGRTPQLIYVIPNFQNPSGTTLSLKRRQQLVELALEWNAVLLEDDPYGLLRFEGSHLPGLRELSGGAPNVVSVYTLSKVLAPGLRLGWVLADPAIVGRMIDAKQGVDTCANVPLQRLAAEFIATGRMEPHLAAVRGICRDNRETMRDALADQLGGGDVRWTNPQGGFFLWLTFPPQVATTKLAGVALEEGVAFVPGSAFSVGGRFQNALRLSFASTSGERTVEGVTRLRRALERVYGERWRRAEL